MIVVNAANALVVKPKAWFFNQAFLYCLMLTKELWEEYKKPIYYFILKWVKQPETSKDILQNTFLRAHLKKHQLRDDKKAKAWLFQIARNEVYTYFAQQKTHLPLLENEAVVENNAAFTPCCWERFLSELPPSYQEVVKLCFIAGKKQQEAAALLGLSLANVKARIRRAKAWLQEALVNCCGYTLDENGTLSGESHCARCAPGI